jgi:hypothetical protein
LLELRHDLVRPDDRGHDRRGLSRLQRGQHYSGIATGPTVQYRLNTLVDRAADQGVLPHLLVAAVLEQRDERTLILPGVDVEFGPNQTT